MDTSMIVVAFLAIGGAVGYFLGRGSGEARATRAVGRYLTQRSPVVAGLSPEQRDQLDAWLSDLGSFLHQTYRWDNPGR